MSLLTITVWDDDIEQAEEWSSNINKLLSDTGHDSNVSHGKKDEIKNDLNELHLRRARMRGENNQDKERSSKLDDTDILILDNDLFDLDDHKDLSAEIVASMARLFTECKLIIVANVTPDTDFDLRLQGYPESQADLHINDKWLESSGLWFECPREDRGFRPWHWPLLVKACDEYDARVSDVSRWLQETPETPILELFEFSETSIERLSRSAMGFLHPAKDCRKVTLMSFTDANPMAVNLKEWRLLKVEKRQALQITRIATSRLHKWLSHLVLGPQDVLVDLPHLAQRYPFLIPEDRRNDLEAWNCLATLNSPPELPELREISGSRFPYDHWLNRPAYWWDQLDSNNENLIDKLLNDQIGNPGEFVFQEDTSTFETAGKTMRFMSSFHSSYDQRYVHGKHSENDRSVLYSPISRFSIVE